MVQSVMVLEMDEDMDGRTVFMVDPILTTEDVERAVSGGLEIYTTDKYGGLDRLLFDGSEWTSDERPYVVDPETGEVPKVEYVDQRFDLLQAEVEALADALLEVDPKNPTAMTVKSQSADARIAMAFDNEPDMDAVIGALRGVPVKEA